MITIFGTHNFVYLCIPTAPFISEDQSSEKILIPVYFIYTSKAGAHTMAWLLKRTVGEGTNSTIHKVKPSKPLAESRFLIFYDSSLIGPDYLFPVAKYYLLAV